MRRLDGKVAIVTGAAMGQGAAHVEALARHGAKVMAVDLAETEGRAVVERLAATGLEVDFAVLDVADAIRWRTVVELTTTRFGAPTVLVNNAGVTARTALAECGDDEWNRAVAVNQSGVFYGMRAVIPAMIEAGGGSIVNIASSYAHSGGHPGYFGYVATKHAVIGMTKNAALTYGAQGIRVNSVSPGLVATRLLGTPEAVEAALELQPIKRPAEPSEIASAVVYLASDEAQYVTGADLLVDGGFTAA